MSPLLALGDQVVLYFDASARHRLHEDDGLYAQLAQYPEHFVEVPSGTHADAALLRCARDSGASIVSRDRYRDFRRRYRKLIADPSRLLTGLVENDRVIVPALALEAPLAPSAQVAWERLEALLIERRGGSGFVGPAGRPVDP